MTDFCPHNMQGPEWQSLVEQWREHEARVEAARNIPDVPDVFTSQHVVESAK
jgi:hypothetical protein